MIYPANKMMVVIMMTCLQNRNREIKNIFNMRKESTIDPAAKLKCILRHHHRNTSEWVTLGSTEYFELLQLGYAYAGPAYVANMDEIRSLRAKHAELVASINTKL